MRVVVSKSTRRGKKYMAALDGIIVHFGATGYNERKKSYLARHKATEDWTLTSVSASIRDINARFSSLSVRM